MSIITRMYPSTKMCDKPSSHTLFGGMLLHCTIYKHNHFIVVKQVFYQDFFFIQVQSVLWLNNIWLFIEKCFIEPR